MNSAKIIISASLLVCLAASTAVAADSRFIKSLSRLDPQTRLEQVCDFAAVSQIGRNDRSMRPDRAKSDVISSPRMRGNTLEGKGGAFRSKGVWYAFSFKCTTSADHLQVLSFTYKVGEPIPKTKWASYGLWD